ncbi:MAG: UDP-N-acetylmuramoyl-tripeptide--D-alanyl-D-alanine ligase [Solirubrobacteraceae bacterium]
MRDWTAERLAEAAGAELLRGAPADRGGPGGPGEPGEPGEPGGRGEHRGPGRPGGQAGPRSVSIDTRTLAPGALFVGLRGRGADGGEHAPAALAAGAWGVLVAPEHARRALRATDGAAGAIFAHDEPLAALQRLARAWREQLRGAGAQVIAVTGSSGKTSTKDILAAMLASFVPTAATPANLNTEIGLPLAILQAPADTGALVLEMAMRGPGQIAELTAIADPDVGVIVNVGPAHLELLGSVEAIAAAKAELLAGMRAGTVAVVPAQEPLLAPHLRADQRTITFGPGGEVELRGRDPQGAVTIGAAGAEVRLQPSFAQAHNLLNLLAAVAVARALGYAPQGLLQVEFSAMRGQRRELSGGISLIEDCYNANPISMRAAIDDLAETAGGRGSGRAVAVLGDMLELGPEGRRLHREAGEHAHAQGVDLLVAVGPLAADIAEGFAGESLRVSDAAMAAERVPALLRAGDTVLLKASRGVGLERVAEALGRS